MITRGHLLRVIGILFALACLAVPADAQTATRAVIRGVVLDRADGAPLADVSVQLQDAEQDVRTDAAGRFELTDVPPGRRTVSVSIVGFILVKRTVEVTAGEALDLTIVLSEGTGTYTETLTVTADRFREQEAAVPAQQTLGSAEIQNLRNLITNDPMRAIQVLPGVSTGDDFRSEFVVRGHGFPRMNFTFDGIATSFLLHTVQQVVDGGSIAMVNGDILDGITLLNGSYPQRHGNRLGAELAFQMREGSRDRTQVRAGVSGTDASLVFEGPFAGKAGSWLVSARKSYLEMLLKQLDATIDFGFGFTDAQSKIVYDVSPIHRLELTLVAGRSLLDLRLTPDQEVNEIKDGRNSGQLVNLGWRATVSPSTVLTQRLAVAGNQFANTDPHGFALDRGAGRDVTWRADLVRAAGAAVTLEAGGQVQRQQRELTVRRFFGPGLQTRALQSYADAAVLSSAYTQARWSPTSRVTLSPGARLDRWSLTRDTSASPWFQGELRLTRSLRLRGGAGIYRQFPGFDEATGFRAGTQLRVERAYHADLGLEQTLGETARWQATVYNREERDLLRLPEAELRVLDGRLVGTSLNSRWVNTLDGYARGVELVVQRRSAGGLSGWASYALAFNRYRDQLTGEAFDGDFDQRHTLNLHASYRLTNRTSVGGKLRYGSNFPAFGYWEQRGSAYFVSSARNELRVPPYARLDLRGSRTYNWQRSRLTLFVELLNALGRENVRFNIPGVDGRTHQAFGLFESMIPRVPSAGILLEF